MASEVEVCNMALFRVGNSQTIASLDEGSTQAIACKAFFAQTRDAVLRDFPWAFATKRAVGQSLSETPPATWGFAYGLPSDCIRLRAIEHPSLRIPRVDQRVPFEISGRSIYTDLEEASLVYTYRATDLSLWDPLAISALAWALAVELALGVVGKPDFANAARQAYRVAITEAWAASLGEGHDNLPESEFITGRN